MKFTDVLKACLRYWFIIVICIVIACPIAIGLTFKDNDYTAKSTMIVEKSEKAGADYNLSQALIESTIKETNMLINHNDSVKRVIDMIEEKDSEFANTLSVNSLRNGLTFNFKKGETFFEITYSHKDADKAKEVVEAVTTLAIEEYEKNETSKVALSQVYSTEIYKNNGNIPVFAIIGILIGLVLGIVIVTFMVVFNPYVEDEELLKNQTGIEVLASLDKEAK